MKKETVIAIIATVAVVLIGIAVIPMPHGGTMGGNMFSHFRYEASRMPEKRAAAEQQKQQENTRLADHRAKMEKRFLAPLPFEIDASKTAAFSNKNWTAGTVGFMPALKDNTIGMIWGPQMKSATETWTMEDVSRAMADCASLEPAGSWALPTSAEFDLAKVNGILDVDDNARNKWLTYISSVEFTLPALRVWRQNDRFISLRCIGRSDTAPLHGYGQEDVSQEIILKAAQ